MPNNECINYRVLTVTIELFLKKKMSIIIPFQQTLHVFP